MFSPHYLYQKQNIFERNRRNSKRYPRLSSHNRSVFWHFVNNDIFELSTSCNYPRMFAYGDHMPVMRITECRAPLIIGTHQQLNKIEIDSVRVEDVDIKPVESVRNLGAWFDKHKSMDVHVGKVCSKAFRGLYNIRQIRKFLSLESTKALVHAVVKSHLDYCNSLLVGIPQHQLQRLQRILNAAARVTCFTSKTAHITQF